MTRPSAAGLLIGAMVALLVGIPAEASAKGAEVVRGYAVVTGPGLAHPIVFSAPWDRSMGGYYSEEAETFVNFATFAGGIPGYVRPSPRAPKPARLDPGYEVIFFRDCCRLAVRQVVYPFAQGGPWVNTPSGQRRAMRWVFGRFWGGGASSGWAQAHQGLVVLLEQRGLPDDQPRPPAQAQTAPAQGSSLWGMAAVLAAFLAIAVALTVRRQHKVWEHGLDV
jgi:hypothetical protein